MLNICYGSKFPYESSWYDVRAMLGITLKGRGRILIEWLSGEQEWLICDDISGFEVLVKHIDAAMLYFIQTQDMG